MEAEIEIKTVDEPTQEVLEAMFVEIIRGKRPDLREICIRLYESLPEGFDPMKINNWLIDPHREVILLEGIFALQGNVRVLEKCDLVILEIRKRLVKDYTLKHIELASLASNLKMTPGELSLYLELIREIDGFWNGASYEQDSLIIKSIDISSERSTFFKYVTYRKIEGLVLKRLKDRALNGIEASGFFDDEPNIIYEREHHYAEMIQKMDEILDAFSDNKRQQEILTREFNDLKNLYFKLNKRSFLQLIKGKMLDIGLSKLFENDTLLWIYHHFGGEWQNVMHLIGDSLK
jgi:hypothetical protein